MMSLSSVFPSFSDLFCSVSVNFLFFSFPPVDLKMDEERPQYSAPPRGFTMEVSIVEAPMSREDRETAAIREAQAAEQRERSEEKLRTDQETVALLEAQAMERQEKQYNEKTTLSIRRVPVPASSINEKSRIERETLAVLEGRSEKKHAGSEKLARHFTAPPIIEQAEIARDDGMDWDAPPPAYEQSFGDERQRISTAVLDNGRISMMFRGRGSMHKFTALPPLPTYEPHVERQRSQAAFSFPLLNIVIQVVGSRGDVQPFIALGQELKLVGHRIRLATHDCFEEFVHKAGLEFFPIGGDPTELMAYMVKNPGIIPKFESIRAGDIAKKRKMISEMLEGCWKSCFEPDPSTNIPFVAEAIIANPPSFAHMHCAQAMGIPVHLMFTMPWSPTRAFPHPLANVQLSDTDPTATNFLSYGLVDMMTWQGLGDVINHFRRKTLNLETLPQMVGANLASDLKIPFTYCWSPALIPKPFDWPSHIDVCGFFFRNAPDYTPFPELDAFLRAGPPPIYIGFGSIVMDNAEKMTQTIMEAVKSCGVRAIVSEGWSKLGKCADPDPDILFIGDCPHGKCNFDKVLHCFC